MAGYGMMPPNRVMSSPKTPPMQVGMAAPQRVLPGQNPMHAQIAAAMGPQSLQSPKQSQIGMFRGARGLAV